MLEAKITKLPKENGQLAKIAVYSQRKWENRKKERLCPKKVDKPQKYATGPKKVGSHNRKNKFATFNLPSQSRGVLHPLAPNASVAPDLAE